ncbi:hypothetical protein [Thiolinea disciformis]|uniref:hypothetical protein n=1 Tax=Thiolinea disciformis TaxID=125614 RepID=UPI0003816F83|nr:hypothetical protein [Thiolinea disciformis]
MSGAALAHQNLDSDAFLVAYRSTFFGVLSWTQLDELWRLVLAESSASWYVYAVGEIPPISVANSSELGVFIRKLDSLLRKEHQESYCGIVYADDLKHPSFIKIFDPHNLGSTCGSSKIKPLPGWILSKLPPVDLPGAFPAPNNRRRWWQTLFN